MQNHILIIEDDKDIREGIRILLEGTVSEYFIQYGYGSHEKSAQKNRR